MQSFGFETRYLELLGNSKNNVITLWFCRIFSVITVKTSPPSRTARYLERYSVCLNLIISSLAISNCANY